MLLLCDERKKQYRHVNYKVTNWIVRALRFGREACLHENMCKLIFHFDWFPLFFFGEYITYYSAKLVSALIVTGEWGAETTADNNNTPVLVKTTEVSILNLYHCTKNFIYTKFTKCKFCAKKCKLRLKKRTKMVNTAFALKFTTPCKLSSKCGIYHLCFWSPPCLLLFATYLHRVNLSKSNFSCSGCYELTTFSWTCFSSSTVVKVQFQCPLS